MTERLRFLFSLSRTGEGNGSPLQCYCLENPRDGGAWWAAVYGVALSRTRLKWHSSSSHSVRSDSLWPHGLQHIRPPCPSLSPWVCWNSCPLRQWCHPAISSSVIPFSSCLQSFPASRSFSNESVPCIRWPKYWSFSFSISPSNECSGLISFRIDWFDLLSVQGTLNSFFQHHSMKASILWHLSEMIYVKVSTFSA